MQPLEPPPPQQPEPSAQQPTVGLADLERQFQSGAKWFAWIAALSIINALLVLAKAPISFPVGLGLTTIATAVAQELGKGSVVVTVAGLIFTAFVSAVFIVMGQFALKKAQWAFWVGMGLYALDGALLIPFRDWVGMAFHAWALWSIWRGLQALKAMPQVPVN